MGTATIVEHIWSLTGGDADTGPGPYFIEPPGRPVSSAFAVAEAAGATVAAATLAANEFGSKRGIAGPSTVEIETDHALADWRAHVLVDGESLPQWAPLSGRYRAANGRFVQLHCNFPHHASGVARRLGTAEDRPEMERAIAGWDAFELEQALIDDGMICAAYRTIEEWNHHPHASATAELPLLDIEQLGHDRPPTAPATSTPTEGSKAGRPLDGVKVLDCSRVLAGPVAGRTLAAHGASVLRVGAAHLPAVHGCVLATGFGKVNTYLDLRTPEGRRDFTGLVEEADVLVDAYRPGALAHHGFDAHRAAEINPGIVVVELCAFDWIGPWAGRRGFDSIVQTTTGVAMAQAEVLGVEEPVHLPVQALDFATGYLGAYAAARLLTRRAEIGGSWRARLSLLRTRNWLLGLGGPTPFEPAGPPTVEPYLERVESPFGTLSAVRPVAGGWDRPPSPLGTHPPTWP